MEPLITEPVPHDQHVQSWKFIQCLAKGGQLVVGREVWKLMFNSMPQHGLTTVVDYPGSLAGICVTCSDFIGSYDMLALDDFWIAARATP